MISRYFPKLHIEDNRLLPALGRTAKLLSSFSPVSRLALPGFNCDPTGSFLKMLPRLFCKIFPVGIPIISPVTRLLAQGRYEDMWLGSLRAQIDGRYVPISDHFIRGLMVIGHVDRCLQLFRQLYAVNPSEFTLGSVSNMFYGSGCEHIPHAFVSKLSNHIDHLAQSSITDLPSTPLLPQRLEVNERPLMVVVSS